MILRILDENTCDYDFTHTNVYYINMIITHTRKDDVHGYFKFTHGPMPMGSSKFLETVRLACSKFHRLR